MNTWVSFQSAEQPLLGQFSVSGNRLAKDVPTASRGDLFVIGSSRYLVEKLIANDGWLLTAATIEEEA
ncbi:hypothetical protein [Pseudomonas aeruginosa]|uniref:hypothetical protein n=1 Tax=Pseudomonas aeruginosa TaxID=287 RepID=UPI001E5148BD|nr:hypothetical protein [Pseudomonas aeruginosa]UHL95979.1 hypothetical protein LVE67_25710 [Pseudomonas aeruginosa]